MKSQKTDQLNLPPVDTNRGDRHDIRFDDIDFVTNDTPTVNDTVNKKT